MVVVVVAVVDVVVTKVLTITTLHKITIQNLKFKSETGMSQHYGSSCYRCGSSNHWSKACRTLSYLCELYQASLKGKEKEVNLIDKFDNSNTELNNLDFISELE